MGLQVLVLETEDAEELLLQELQSGLVQEGLGPEQIFPRQQKPWEEWEDVED